MTASLFALLIGAPIAALTPQAQAPTWPVDRPARANQEGDEVHLLVRALNHQDGVTTYSVSGQPRGITIDPATGMLSGTLEVSPPNTLNGSAGQHTVTVTATNGAGSSPYQFTWRVSRFRKGDVFAGIGQGRYKVFDENGNEKYTLTAETQSEWENSGAGGSGTTTGCAYNWATRKMYFTSYDTDNDPSVTEIDPVPAAGGEPFPRGKISTFRDSGLEVGQGPTGRSVDNAPESVVFGTDVGPDGQLNTADDRVVMYVGHAGGLFDEEWYPVDAAGRRIVAEANDGTSNYGYVNEAGELFTWVDPDGVTRNIYYAQGFSVAGILERWPGRPYPGNPRGLIQWGRDIQQFVIDKTTGAASRTASFDAHAGWQGSDWMDLASDQHTMYYTSEWGVIYKYDVGRVAPADGRQRAPFATLPARDNHSEVLYALRLLPPGDGTGGLLVAAGLEIWRFSGDGRLISKYDGDGTDGWFALNLAPDGRSFWSADTGTGKIYKFDIARGRSLPLGPSNSTNGLFAGADPIAWTELPGGGQGAPTQYSLNGLCVMGEYTAAQEVCGNNIDDDADGLIDEVCQPVESCSNDSPGDDDLDGLVDTNDPDCGARDVCTAGAPTDPSVPGFCARYNLEGDQVSVMPAPGPTTQSGLYETYNFTGLPGGLVAAANGLVTGSPRYDLLKNPPFPATAVFPVTIAVQRKRVSDNVLVSSFTQSFNWTIENKNRPPVASPRTLTLRPGQNAVFPVQVSDPDTEDTVTFVSSTPPQHGTLQWSGNTYTYTPAAGYLGADSFTYTVKDGPGLTATATVSITIFNDPPTTAPDAATTIAGFASAPISVLANDPPDPNADAVTLASFTQGARGTVTRSGNALTYTPTGTFVGVDTFTYTVSDGFGGTATGLVTVTVTNRAPVALPDIASARGSFPVTVSVIANDGDPDNHPIALAGATNPANGSITVNANGSITYTANAGFQGSDVFFYTIRDGFGGEATSTVTINVGPPNRFDSCTCASAKPSLYEIWPPNHKRTEVVGITNVVDPNGGPVTIKILGIYQDEPTNYLGDGDTTIDAGGVGTSQAWVRAERTGNPNAGDNGRVYEIVFEATGADGSHCEGKVYTGVPHDQGQGHYIWDDGIRYDSTVAGGPIVREALQTERHLTDADITSRGFVQKFAAQARIGSASTTEMQIGPTIAAPVAADDFDWVNGDPVSFVLWRMGRITYFMLVSDTQFKFVAYNVDCDSGQCNDVFLRAQAAAGGTVTVSSLAVNGRPVPDTLTVLAGSDPRALRLTGLILDEGVVLTGVVRMNWTTPAPAGDQLNFQVLVGKACPPEGSTGGGGGAGTPPIARSDVYSTPEDVALNVPARGLLTNDLTFAGLLSATLVEQPAHGTVAISADGAFSYTPAENFYGVDTFRYRVSDGERVSEPAAVTINVAAVADAPVAVNDAATTNESTPVAISVLGNDSDIGGSLSIASFTQPANGTVTASGSQLLFTPANRFVGTSTFTYTLQGSEGQATASVTVTVLNVNDPPVAVNDAYTLAEDATLTIAAPGLNGNDTDPDAGDVLAAAIVTLPQHGTVTVNENGSFVYVPAPNYYGSDTFTYRLTDAAGVASNAATVTLTVTPVNDAPVAVGESYLVSEDGVLQINAPGIKANDSDAESATSSLVVTLATGPQRGSLTLNGDGSFIYTPLPNVSGADSFVYRISDGSLSSTATVNIAIAETPDAPVAVADAASTQEDGAVTINVLANDSDPDGTAPALQGVSQPANGTAVVIGGQVRYTPRANFYGQDTFTYTITDGARTASASVTVTVSSVNDLPVATADSYSTPRRTVLSVPAPGVLANDSDIDSQNLIAKLVSGPANGTLTLQANGSFAYDPDSNFTGTDSFTYRVNDGAADGNAVTVTIVVTAPNRAPIAGGDAFGTEQNKALTIAAPGVLANDSDADGDALTAVLVSAPAAGTGTVALSANGAFVYTPPTGYTGTTSFRYRARDTSSTDSADATVTITVTMPNRAPVAANDSYTAGKNQALTVAAPGLLSNDTDADADTLTAVLVTAPAASTGTVALNANGSFTFTPASGYTGTASFTYRAKDPDNALSSTATVTITISNTAPVAVNDSYTTNKNTTLTVAAPGVLDDDSDPNGDAITAVLVAGPASGTGTLTLNANGSFTFTPASNYVGTATFTYRAKDGANLQSSIATVTITVLQPNRAPVASGDAYTVVRNTDLVVSAPGILADDTDADGDPLTAVLVTGPSATAGTLVLNANGSFTFTPVRNYTGTATFTYRAKDDSNALSGIATVTITVTK